jgi:uncharacterized protein YndB with AHSA1/START domain
MASHSDFPNPELDLVFERVIDVPREKVWAAWTIPELLTPLICPLPWKTVDCEIELRPGGMFRTVMRSPEGQEFPNLGCYLEIIPNEKLVWTNALEPDFRPAKLFVETPGHECAEFAMTAVITLEPTEQGLKYKALVMHSSGEHRARHEKMGFQEGWGKALDQMLEMIKNS